MEEKLIKLRDNIIKENNQIKSENQTLGGRITTVQKENEEILKKILSTYNKNKNKSK